MRTKVIIFFLLCYNYSQCQLNFSFNIGSAYAIENVDNVKMIDPSMRYITSWEKRSLSMMKLHYGVGIGYSFNSKIMMNLSLGIYHLYDYDWFQDFNTQTGWGTISGTDYPKNFNLTCGYYINLSKKFIVSPFAGLGYRNMPNDAGSSGFGSFSDFSHTDVSLKKPHTFFVPLLLQISWKPEKNFSIDFKTEYQWSPINSYYSRQIIKYKNDLTGAEGEAVIDRSNLISISLGASYYYDWNSTNSKHNSEKNNKLKKPKRNRM